jgi:phosphoglycolate phosphatase-like HAD superfamily hydrolase
VIDLNLLRENPEAIKASQRARGRDEKLVDQAAEADAWSEACRHTGEEPTPRALAMGLVGAPLDEIQKVVFGSASVSFGDAFRACQRQNPDLDTLIPGALRLLSALSKAGISFGLATSRPAWRCEKGLELLQLGDFRDVFSADTELSKPSGEIVRKIACERGLQTGDIWMLGDSQIDQQTAIAGGCIFVFAEWGLSQSPISADYSFQNFGAIFEALGLKN